MSRNSDRKYGFYICGKCGHEIYRKINESDTIPCNECGAIYTGTSSATSNDTTGGAIGGGDLSKTKGYIHRDRPQHDIPSEIKLDLAKPTQKPSGY